MPDAGKRRDAGGGWAVHASSARTARHYLILHFKLTTVRAFVVRYLADMPRLVSPSRVRPAADCNTRRKAERRAAALTRLP